MNVVIYQVPLPPPTTTDSLARRCTSWRRPSVKRLRLFELQTDYACQKDFGKKKKEAEPEQSAGGSSGDSQLIREIVRLSVHDRRRAFGSVFHLLIPPFKSEKEKKMCVWVSVHTQNAPFFLPPLNFQGSELQNLTPSVSGPCSGATARPNVDDGDKDGFIRRSAHIHTHVR